EGHGTTTEIQNYQFIDNIRDIQATSLSYRLKQMDYDGSYEYSDVVEVTNLAPTDFALHQNYPNPFNPVTTISYSLPVKSQVELVVYNTLGESVMQLVNEEKDAGRYEVKLDATALSSGVYIYHMRVNDFIDTKKMILLR
ncbi:MAG: T9SS type A sorting domain-containing protein, partial [Ignavibacteriaceae bacterium]